jgi:hypothetical protein
LNLYTCFRLEKIVQLFQKSQSFVTYTNLSAKIDACLASPNDRFTSGGGAGSAGGHSLSHLLQERRMSLERNWTGRVMTLYSPRLEALKSVLVGKEDGVGMFCLFVFFDLLNILFFF